ncbi:MAG: type II toxin-antitoxin system HicA family toxin [Chloroflexi bacterium]|nr:type II toxin-antitoxin system HicA family toxin [Chloroflexota bacterium]
MSTGSRRLVPLPPRVLVRIFEASGFKAVRMRGDHLIMTKPGVIRPVVIQMEHGLVPVTHIRTNMTTAGMSREEFFALLDQVQ